MVGEGKGSPVNRRVRNSPTALSPEKIDLTFNDNPENVLNFNYQNTGDELNALVKKLQNQPYQGAKLSLIRNAIGLEGIKQLMSVLNKLDYLDLQLNLIDYYGAKEIGEALKSNDTLTFLDLSHNPNIQSPGRGIIHIAYALQKNKSLKTLNLMMNNIEDIGAKHIGNALKQNNTLTSLDLRGNQIGDEGAAAIADGLENNHTLTSLDLRRNQIGDEGLIKLAEFLTKNKSLKSVYLSSNTSDITGLDLIADALKTDDVLTSLYLNFSNVKGRVILDIAESLKSNNTLTTLDLSLDTIGYEGAKKIAELLQENHSITSFSLAGNGIGDEGVIEIAEVLIKNQSITSFGLEGREIGDEGAAAIAKVLINNPFITDLSLGGKITYEGEKKLTLALMKNPTLVNLELYDVDDGVTKIDEKGYLKDIETLLYINREKNEKFLESKEPLPDNKINRSLVLEPRSVIVESKKPLLDNKDNLCLESKDGGQPTKSRQPTKKLAQYLSDQIAKFQSDENHDLEELMLQIKTMAIQNNHLQASLSKLKNQVQDNTNYRRNSQKSTVFDNEVQEMVHYIRKSLNTELFEYYQACFNLLFNTFRGVGVYHSSLISISPDVISKKMEIALTMATNLPVVGGVVSIVEQAAAVVLERDANTKLNVFSNTINGVLSSDSANKVNIKDLAMEVAATLTAVQETKILNLSKTPESKFGEFTKFVKTKLSGIETTKIAEMAIGDVESMFSALMNRGTGQTINNKEELVGAMLAKIDSQWNDAYDNFLRTQRKSNKLAQSSNNAFGTNSGGNKNGNSKSTNMNPQPQTPGTSPGNFTGKPAGCGPINCNIM